MRFYLYFVSCFLVLVFSKASLASDALTTSSSCVSLVASGNAEYPPFLWRQNDAIKELKGVNRLIIDELSKRIQIPIKLIYVGPWAKAQSDAKKGHIDLLAGAFYTNERADYMYFFTPVLLHTTSVVWQSKNRLFIFNRKEDLQEKWGVTVINNSLGQKFDHYAKHHLNVLSVASISHALQMLMAGEVDYVLYEKAPAYAYVSLLGLSDSIVPMSPHLSSESVYFTLSKKSSCNTTHVKQAITDALQEMKEDGFIAQAIIDGVQEWENKDRNTVSLD